MFSRKIQSFLKPFTVAMTLVVLMSAQSQLSADESHSKSLEGSWIGTVTATNPPGLPAMKSLLSFTGEGIVIESRRLYVGSSPFGPLMETAGHGEWVRTGKGEFTVKFIFLTQRGPVSDGDAIGTDNITMKLVLDDSGDRYSGTFVSEIRDNDDNVMFVASGVVQGARIRAPR